MKNTLNTVLKWWYGRTTYTFDLVQSDFSKCAVIQAKEEGYTFGKWQENEMDRVMREFHDQIMAEFYNKPAPVPKTTKPPQPVNFR